MAFATHKRESACRTDLHQVGFLMAVSTPVSPAQNRGLKDTLPMPPPLLHTRSGNEIYEGVQTPTCYGFTSPAQTPVGSPSKKQLPPGANDLPNVFDSALKLAITSPSKIQAGSPNRQGLSIGDDNVQKDPFADPAPYSGRSESPTRQSNKENAPSTAGRYGKDVSIQQNHAAISRQEQYQLAETRKSPLIRGLSTEEVQKLQLPRVKRLANVTQLCKFLSISLQVQMLTCERLPGLLL